MKNRLPEPSEICALELKGEFRRFGICSVSATIGINWSISEICGESSVSAWPEKDRQQSCPGTLCKFPPAVARNHSGPTYRVQTIGARPYRQK
jgi:hypothetical protein